MKSVETSPSFTHFSDNCIGNQCEEDDFVVLIECISTVGITQSQLLGLLKQSRMW